MTSARLHGWLGLGIVLAFLALALWGLGLRVLGREEAPTAYRAVQHWTENLLALQTLVGVVFLLIGRRVIGDDLVFFHYLYGSLFPLIAVVAGRIAGLRRESHEYVGWAWGAFFSFGLTTRALMTGCGEVLSWSCFA